jgi:hypothetical protein
MNREQKIALTIVITCTAGLLIGIAMIIMRCFGIVGLKTTIVLPFLIAGSGGIITLIFFRKPDKGPVTFDERDKLFDKNANLAGFGAVFLYIILMSFLPIAILGEKGSIPVTWCPALLIGAAFFYVYARSIAVLIQYGWKKEGSNE